MPFSPWREHEVQYGQCIHCGLKVPDAALFLKDGKAHTFSHVHTDGYPVFCPKPGGRTEPCRSEK